LLSYEYCCKLKPGSWAGLEDILNEAEKQPRQ